MKRIAIAAALAACAVGAAAQDKPNPMDVVPDKMPNDIAYGTPVTLERKARASVKFRRETKAFEAGVQGGNNYLLTLDDVIASRGGIMLMDGGRIVGAIGCSGGTGSQDEVVCRAGAEAVKR